MTIEQKKEALCKAIEIAWDDAFGGWDDLYMANHPNVPVMGNEKLLVLPPIEITSSGKFYDYESKYTPGGSRHIIPARISAEVEKKVKAIAAKAYAETGCRGLARVDMMLDEKGDSFVIEINTSPGMTETSLFPDAARAAGIAFPELCETLVDLALEK